MQKRGSFFIVFIILLVIIVGLALVYIFKDKNNDLSEDISENEDIVEQESGVGETNEGVAQSFTEPLTEVAESSTSGGGGGGGGGGGTTPSTGDTEEPEEEPDTNSLICQNAQDDELCDGLNVAYGDGYKTLCCSEHRLCC